MPPQPGERPLDRALHGADLARRRPPAHGPAAPPSRHPPAAARARPPRRARGVDAVLLSHAHHDHLDIGSLQRVGRKTPLVAPRGLGPSCAARASATSMSSRPERASRSAASGSRRRSPRTTEPGRPTPPRAPPLGYAVLGSRRVYFAGDTDLFPEMDGLVPHLDLALVPIWGWGPTLGKRRPPRPRGSGRGRRPPAPGDRRPIHWGTYAPLYLGHPRGARVPRRAAGGLQRRGRARCA